MNSNLSPEATKSKQDADTRRKLYTARAELTVRLRCSTDGCTSELYGNPGQALVDVFNDAHAQGWRAYHDGKQWQRKCPVCATLRPSVAKGDGQGQAGTP